LRYLGGKSKEAARILEVVLKDREPDQLYIEPFCGGCNVIDKVTGPRWGNDFNWQLIELWQAVQQGGQPPENVAEDDYRRIRADRLGDPALHAFVACAGSWGGKWWGGYARGNAKNGTPRNFVDEGRRHVLKQAPKLAGVRFTAGSYSDMDIPPCSVVYCDPPYVGTTAYKDTGAWDAGRFWSWARDLARFKGCDVFVSEFEAPDDWTCVLEFERACDLRNLGHKELATKKFTEKLFRWIPRLPAGEPHVGD
jgi:DNA adenine methylase